MCSTLVEFFQTCSWCVGDLTDSHVSEFALRFLAGDNMVLWLPQQLVRKWVTYSLITMMSKLGTVTRLSCQGAQTNAADWNNNNYNLTKKKTGKAP